VYQGDIDRYRIKTVRLRAFPQHAYSSRLTNQIMPSGPVNLQLTFAKLLQTSADNWPKYGSSGSVLITIDLPAEPDSPKQAKMPSAAHFT
jgi:hypothetical protein